MENVKEQLTTAEVLDRFRRLGLCVTEKQIANDTVDRFLPPRPLGQAREGRGRTGLWEPWMVRRAERLYRLRRRKGADGQPMVYGDTLRILLFIRDGWGWSTGIRDLCLQGLEKGRTATLAPARRYMRGPADREKVEFALDAHDVDLIPAERYAVGMAAFGQPLEGGSLKGLFRAAQVFGLVDFPPEFVKLFEPLGVRDSVDLASKLAAPLVRGQAALKALLENFSDRDAGCRTPQFIAFITRIRRALHRMAITEGQPGHPSNPLTFFGRTQRELEREFRAQKMPQRVTPAQMLAMLIGFSILANYLLDIGERIARFALNVARRVFGWKLPTEESQIAPFAFNVVQHVYGVPIMEQFKTK